LPEIAGNSAILVNPLETAAIRTAVVNFIESEELREKYIKLGYENIKRFSVQHITNQYLNIYKEITAK
jgi:glycosyltransferase involved in cell wall biosynthesis